MALVFLNLDVNRVNQEQFPIRYKDIYWNGKVNNVGSTAPRGTYYYTLTLYNCKYRSGKVYKKYVMLL